MKYQPLVYDVVKCGDHDGGQNLCRRNGNFTQLLQHEKNQNIQKRCKRAGKNISPYSLNMWPGIWKGQRPLQSVIGNSSNDTPREGSGDRAHPEQNQTGHGSPVKKGCHSSSCNKSANSCERNFFHPARNTFAIEAFGVFRTGY